jgi:hypothetical protein
MWCSFVRLQFVILALYKVTLNENSLKQRNILPSFDISFRQLQSLSLSFRICRANSKRKDQWKHSRVDLNYS